MALSLVSVNIEKDKHFDLVLPFIERVQPDVLCVQECFQTDLPRIAKVMGGADPFYAPKCFYKNTDELFGTAIFSRLPMTDTRIEQYGGAAKFGNSDHTSPETLYATMQFKVAVVTVEKDEQSFRIGTVHFPLTRAGAVSEYQRDALRNLKTALAKEERLILCGDFNAPRGGEIFSELATTWKDNIPAHYKTSLDLDIHRNGKVNAAELADKMVDGLFTTPHYKATNVELVCGVSDHCAIVAEITASV
jgi:endonuclease/exonuclease/phosphatase family metal-dependent hydrolase